MDVAEEGHPNDILVTLHKRAEALGPLAQTVTVAWWMVSNEDSHFSVFLHLSECAFEPSQLVTWITHFGQKEQIVIVAGLGVDRQDSHLVMHTSITSLEALRVKAVLQELSHRLISKPLLPGDTLMVNDWISLTLSKVHRVEQNAIVMVTIDHIRGPIIQILFHKIG